MTTYIIVLFILSILCVFKHKRWPLFISFAVLLIIGGFRDFSVGTDTENYRLLYDWFGADSQEMYHAADIGYAFLQRTIVLLGGTYRTLVFSCTIIILLMLYFYAIRISPNPHTVILSFYLLYFFFYSFNITRQFIGILFVLIGFYYSEKGKNHVLLISVVLGSLFHLSALLGLVALVLKKERSTYPLILSLFITYLIGISPYIAEAMNTILNYLPSGMIPYVENESGYRESLLSISRLLLNAYCIYLIISLKKTPKLNFLVLGICILNLFSFQPVIARLAQYFTCIQIGIIPNIDELARQHKNINQIKTVSYAYMFVTWIYLLYANVAGVVPYKFGGFHLL